jgi:type II secretory pathway pseudopilin PulG
MRTQRERGQILPLVGIAIAALLAFAALAVDLGYQRYQQRLQQTAADSAAIAGAYEKMIGTSFSNAAKQDASTNGFTDNGSSIKVVACSPPSSAACIAGIASDPYGSDNNAVEADIQVQHPSFFAAIFGGNTTVTTRAVATTKATGVAPPCMYLLSTTQQDNFNKDTVTAPGCGIVTDGVTNFTGATVTAASVECANTCSGLSNPAPVSVAPAVDPCPTIPGCLYMFNHLPSTSGCQASLKTGAGNVTVPAGCYQGMDLTKSTQVTFSCGLYVIYNGTLNANAGNNAGKGGSPLTTLTQSSCSTGGVTFYITGTGSIDIAVQNMNLLAPTAGDYSAYSAGEQGVLFYQDPSDTSTVNLKQANCNAGTCVDNLAGLLYFPTQQVNFNKTTANTAGSGYPVLVFGSTNCNSCNFTLNQTSGTSGPSVKKPVLVE